jgi:hypothetical protein
MGNATRLKWTGDCTGIRIQAYNTTGVAGVTAPGLNAGAFTIIRRIGLVGPYYNCTNFTGYSEGEHHAIHAKSNYLVEDVYINGFAGDGLHARTSVGAGAPTEGNSNCSFVNRMQVSCVRNGVYLDGADANACTLTGVIGTYCRQHTVWDSSFLGNTHIGHHSANAGLVPGVPPSVVSHGGNNYGVRQGRTATASVNAPSGTTADSDDWLYLVPGGAVAALNIPLWSNGVALREGGGFRSDNPNARNTFIGCYQEGGEAPFQFVSPTIVMGGFMPVTSNTTGNVYQGDVLLAPNGVKLGKSQVAADLGPTESVLTVTNSHALTNAYKSRLRIAQGYEADGVTPCKLVDLIGISIGADPATNKAEALLALRDTGGTMSTILNVAPFSNASVYPEGDNWLDWGLGVFRYKTIYGYTGDFKTQVKVDGIKVVGAQGAALPTNASDLASALSLVNAIKARLVAHGLVAA